MDCHIDSAELVREDASFVVFEGTYTAEFADRPRPTPKYNYNQVLYRLDLDDPRLAGAAGQARARGPAARRDGR